VLYVLASYGPHSDLWAIHMSLGSRLVQVVVLCV